jgi:peptide/nickel transport system permease protein
VTGSGLVVSMVAAQGRSSLGCNQTPGGLIEKWRMAVWSGKKIPSGEEVAIIIRFISQRILQSAVVIFIVATLTFFLINLAPGGPSAVTRIEASAAERQALIERYQLDKPILVRYGQWLKNAATGDLGVSFSSGQPVIQRIQERLPNTVLLTVATMAICIIAGMFLGIMAAIRQNSATDYIVGFLSVLGLSLPAFWLGIMLILFFSVNHQWLPSSGVATSGGGFSMIDRIKHLIMPVLVLSATTLPNIVRFTRSSMVEVISQDYIRTARAKGLSGYIVIYKHALKNALIPVVTMIGLLIPRLMGGAVITEAVFSWPGMGQLVVEAANGRDYPLVMGVTVAVTLVVVLTNIMVDLLYTRIDPRIRTAQR